MKILLTGASGFASGHLLTSLRSAGHDVLACVRSVAAAGGIPDALLVEDLREIAPFLAGIDVVVHAAGVAHQSGGSGAGYERLFEEGNTETTVAIADAVAASDVRAMIHLSSIAASGYTQFSGEGGLSESSQREPSTPYGRSKLRAEAPVLALAQHGKLGVNLRPPLIYGKGAKGNWPKLIQLAKSPFPLPFGSVRNRRSFLGMDYLAETVKAILERMDDSERSGTYHIADQDIVSLREIIASLRGALGRKPRLLPFPPGIMTGILNAAGRGGIADGLFSDLIIDSSKIREAFSLPPGDATLASMVLSLDRSGEIQ